MTTTNIEHRAAAHMSTGDAYHGPASRRDPYLTGSPVTKVGRSVKGRIRLELEDGRVLTFEPGRTLYAAGSTP